MTQIEYYCCFDKKTFEPCTPEFEVRNRKSDDYIPVCREEKNKKYLRSGGFQKPKYKYYRKLNDLSIYTPKIYDSEIEKAKQKKRSEERRERIERRAKIFIPELKEKYPNQSNEWIKKQAIEIARTYY